MGYIFFIMPAVPRKAIEFLPDALAGRLFTSGLSSSNR